MNSGKEAKPQRQESDRHLPKKWYSALLARPEIGPLGVMLLLFGMLGYFSIPEGQFSLNPFSGEGFNALGIRNNFRVIAQLGIVALGAGLLIISGEFDLSIGSMIGFAGGCMAMILKWGFAIVIPYISFSQEFSIEGYKIFEIQDVSPLTAILITLCFTLSFGWLQGYVIVKSGIASFIVTLGGLFFLRGVTEVCYRAFNKREDQTAGSTTVTDLPDIKNIINVPGHGEMERDAILSHGISSFLKESFMERSDKYKFYISTKTGLISAVNPDKNIYRDISTDETEQYIDDEGNVVKLTKDNTTSEFVCIEAPYTFKLFLQEVESMGIAPRLIADSVLKQWKQLNLQFKDIPTNEEMLRKKREVQLYNESKKSSILVKPFIRFQNMVRLELLSKTDSINKKLIDFSCNKGDDLFKWSASKFNKIIAFDIESKNIDNPTDGANKKLEDMKNSDDNSVARWSNGSDVTFIVGDSSPSIKYAKDDPEP